MTVAEYRKELLKAILEQGYWSALVREINDNFCEQYGETAMHEMNNEIRQQIKEALQ